MFCYIYKRKLSYLVDNSSLADRDAGVVWNEAASEELIVLET